MCHWRQTSRRPGNPSGFSGPCANRILNVAYIARGSAYRMIFVCGYEKKNGPQCAQNGCNHRSTRTPGVHSALILWLSLREPQSKFKGLTAYTRRIDAYRIAGGTKAFVASFHNANYVRLQHLFVGCHITHWLIPQPVWFWLKFCSPSAFWRVTQQPGSELFIISRDIKFEPRSRMAWIFDRYKKLINMVLHYKFLSFFCI